MKTNLEQLDEVNMLFETIKSMLLTWLPQTKVKNLLKDFTHFEIRSWKHLNWKFVITDLVIHDWMYCKQVINLTKKDK